MILDNGKLDRAERSGVRSTIGFAIDDGCTEAVEVSGFSLPKVTAPFTASSATYPVLARPFFSLNEATERVQFVGKPGTDSGTLHISAPSELWGMEVNGRCLWCSYCDYRIDMLAGFRFMDLREQLEIVEDIQNLPGGPNPFNGTHVIVRDSFATSNQFYGGQGGVEVQKLFGRFSFDGVFKLAMGDTHQSLTIQGSQTFPPGTPNVDTRPGGLLALDSNIGTYSRDRFSIMPELGMTLGYYLTDHVQLTMGYNVVYWSSVARPGDQIDRNLDVTRIPNFQLANPVAPVSGLQPHVLFKDTDLWAQGLSFGLRFSW